ncbi:hypothetical protein ACV242_001927 [Peribacillus simplex]
MNTRIRTCEQLGMVKSSISASDSNFKALLKAINDGFVILVDDQYYLSTLSTVRSTMTIIIKGISAEAEFVLTRGSAYIEVADARAIEVTNIKFSNISKEITKFFTLTDFNCIKYIESIYVSNCEFGENISFFRSTVGITSDPTIQKYGIGTFTFKENKIKNSNSSFITIADVPIEKVLLADNVIQNFSYVFFHSGINNAHSYINEMVRAKETLIIRDNKVTIDDNYWGLYSPENSYYCFVLAEGFECKYYRNHVEGLKMKEVIALYDAYLSVINLEYYENTWINNICFNTNKTNNCLLKSKGGGTNNTPATRIHKNNYYKVTKEFAERIGESPSNLFVDLIDIESNMGNYTIDSNTFEIYELLGTTVTRDINRLYVTNNKFSCSYMSGGLPMIRSNAGIDYSGVYSVIKGNVIKTKNKSSRLNFPVQLFGMADLSDGVNPYSSVIIEDNHIVSTDPRIITNGISCENLFMKNNVLEAKNPTTTPMITYGTGNVNNLTLLDSNFESSTTNYCEQRILFSDSKVFERYSIKSLGMTDSWRGLLLNRNRNTRKVYKYIRKYEILTKDNHYIFDYSFLYGYDDVNAANYVIFTNSSDVDVKVLLYNYKNASISQNGTEIKLHFDKGSGFQIQFDNNSIRSGFKPVGISSNEFVLCNVETISFELT